MTGRPSSVETEGANEMGFFFLKMWKVFPEVKGQEYIGCAKENLNQIDRIRMLYIRLTRSRSIYSYLPLIPFKFNRNSEICELLITIKRKKLKKISHLCLYKKFIEKNRLIFL